GHQDHALVHPPGGGLGAIEDSGEVHVQHALPVRLLDLEEGLPDRDARVRDQYVECPDPLKCRLDCFPVRDVETDRLDARDALGRGGDLLLAEREGRDVRAFLQEAAARRLADPARASGDDDTLVAETFHAATIYS